MRPSALILEISLVEIRLADFDHNLDAQVRMTAFSGLDGLVKLHGEVIPWSCLNEGFVFDQHRIRIIGPQGIFKPGQLRAQDEPDD